MERGRREGEVHIGGGFPPFVLLALLFCVA